MARCRRMKRKQWFAFDGLSHLPHKGSEAGRRGFCNPEIIRIVGKHRQSGSGRARDKGPGAEDKDDVDAIGDQDSNSVEVVWPEKLKGKNGPEDKECEDGLFCFGSRS